MKNKLAHPFSMDVDWDAIGEQIIELIVHYEDVHYNLAKQASDPEATAETKLLANFTQGVAIGLRIANGDSFPGALNEFQQAMRRMVLLREFYYTESMATAILLMDAVRWYTEIESLQESKGKQVLMDFNIDVIRKAAKRQEKQE